MPSPSHIERVKPLLGTFVKIRVSGLDEPEAQAAIDGAFHIVAGIHRLMSFHESASDVSRLNRRAHYAPVRVDAHTYTVLSHAMDLARASQGDFDPTVAAQLTTWGLLPRPDGTPYPHDDARWTDIALLPDYAVAFARPLWIDLSGIAKGYAVDCATDYLVSAGASQVAVDAGGDLRVAGSRSERVLLATPKDTTEIAALEIENAAVASSCGQDAMQRWQGRPVGPHVDGRSRQPCSTGRFVSVVASCCMEADTLTKIVMARGTASAAILRSYGAQAYLYEHNVWSAIAEAA